MPAQTNITLQKNVFFPFLSSCLEQDSLFLHQEAQENCARLKLNSSKNLIIIEFDNTPSQFLGYHVVSPPHLSIFERSSDFYHYTARLQSPAGENFVVRFYFDTHLMLPSRSSCKQELSSENAVLTDKLPANLVESLKSDALNRVRYWTPIIKSHRDHALSMLLDEHTSLNTQLQKLLIEESSDPIEQHKLLDQMIELCRNIEKAFPQTAKKSAVYQVRHYNKIRELMTQESPVVSEQSSPTQSHNKAQTEPTSGTYEKSVLFSMTKSLSSPSKFYTEVSDFIEKIKRAQENLAQLHAQSQGISHVVGLVSLIDHFFPLARETYLQIIGATIESFAPTSSAEKNIQAKFFLRSQSFNQQYDDVCYALAQRLLEVNLNFSLARSTRELALPEASRALIHQNPEFMKIAESLQNPDNGSQKLDSESVYILTSVAKEFEQEERELKNTELIVKTFAPVIVPEILQKIVQEDCEKSSLKYSSEPNSLLTKICAVLATLHLWKCLDAAMWKTVFSCHIDGQSQRISLEQYVAHTWVENQDNPLLLCAALTSGTFDLSLAIKTGANHTEVPLGAFLIRDYHTDHKVMISLQHAYDDSQLFHQIHEPLKRALQSDAHIEEKFFAVGLVCDFAIEKGMGINELIKLTKSFFAVKPLQIVNTAQKGSLSDMFHYYSSEYLAYTAAERRGQKLFALSHDQRMLMSKKFATWAALSNFIYKVAKSCLPSSDEQEHFSSLFNNTHIPDPRLFDTNTYPILSTENADSAIRYHQEVIRIIVASNNPKYANILEQFYCACQDYKSQIEAARTELPETGLLCEELRLFESFSQDFMARCNDKATSELFHGVLASGNPLRSVYWDLAKKHIATAAAHEQHAAALLKDFGCLPFKGTMILPVALPSKNRDWFLDEFEKNIVAKMTSSHSCKKTAKKKKKK